MDRDDETVGRILSRREMVHVLGASSLLLLPGQGAWRRAVRGVPAGLPDCIVRPAQTEGPYFVDTGLERSDIRSDPTTGTVCAGLPLTVGIAVARMDRERCTPIAGAHVEVWHCDAAGVYSGVTDKRFTTVGKQFLRGYQLTNAEGVAQFTTIYPGWYPERTVHIHFKIRTDPAAARGYEFTSQLYFDDAQSDKVFTRPPYAERGQRYVRNPGDGIFRKSGGKSLLFRPTAFGEGLAGTFPIGLIIDG
jgi:protocatechuate 3,4-dioxygenase beta subunit